MFQAEESDYEDWTEAMSVLINKIERKNGLNEQQKDENLNNNAGRKCSNIIYIGDLNTGLVQDSSATKQPQFWMFWISCGSE